ncbi:HNH endonuclease [Novosphingobium sp.]|uniref:HNH endonuclease n=1 Tax=Novosphingobium sp. TaxID=1874826 RepID=UPI000F43CD3E|nr:HNH endonuclease [Sphingomonas sp.]RJT24198.1 hypothetical protein D5I55_01385 [Chakrabartia godavariana]
MAHLDADTFERLLSIINGEDCVEVRVGRTRHALIDRDDHPLVAGHSWRFNGRYAYAKSGSQTILMHRLLTGAEAGFVVDHIDGDGLNNQRYNLRVCTQAENALNRRRTFGMSRFKGVYFDRGGWRSAVQINGRRHRLGTFTTEEQAARAYDKKAVELHGQFAATNMDLGLFAK